MNTKDIKKPNTLEECFTAIKEMLTPAELDQIMMSREEDLPRYHFGLGMWMRNNWGLWQGGPLHNHFKAMGIWHADDMSGIIIDSFHRHVRNEPVKLDEQIKFYQDHWKKYGYDTSGNKI